MLYNEVILLLGSNLGDLPKNMADACFLISKRIGKILKKSEVIPSEPVEFLSEKLFLNMALTVQTDLSPIGLLRSLKAIEREMGREKDSSDTNMYTDRTIDIDVVRYGNIRFYCERLEIPHIKHLYEREFSKKLLEQLDQSQE